MYFNYRPLCKIHAIPLAALLIDVVNLQRYITQCRPDVYLTKSCITGCVRPGQQQTN